MRYSRADNTALILAILICIAAVNMNGCFVADTVQRGDASRDTVEKSLPKRTDFRFSGTVYEAIREYNHLTGQSVSMREYFKKLIIEGYIPPANRMVNIDVSGATAEEVATIIAEQAGIEYVSNPNWGIIFVRPPLSEELPLEKVLQVIKKAVDDRMESDMLSLLGYNDDLLAINEPFYIAKAIGSYLKAGDIETRQKALYLICDYCRDAFTPPSRDWEQMRKIHVYLHPLIEKVVWELVEEHQWAVPVVDLDYACGEHSIPILKKLLEKEEYQFSAALGLAYQGDDSGLKYLKEGLSDNRPLIRFKATEALWVCFGNKEGLDVMIEDIKRAPAVREPIRSAYIYFLESMTLCPYFGGMAGLETMIAEIRKTHTGPDIGSYIYILEAIGNEKAVPVLIEQIMGPESANARMALERIVKRNMPNEYTSIWVSEEEAYRNWKKWWEERQKERKKLPDEE